MFKATPWMAWISIWAFGLTACGGGGGSGPPPPTYTVGGSITGLNTGTSVVLQNNGGNNLSLNAEGNFTFSTAQPTGATYNVTVGTQPSSQICTVANGSGTVASAAVTTVNVSCTPLVGRFLYLPNRDSNNVSAYSINASTGALTEIAGSPFAADQAPSLVTADAAGKLLYVINSGSTLVPPRMSSYTIGANGALVQNALSPFAVTSSGPVAGPAAFGKPIVHSSGKFIYLSGAGDMLYGASTDAAGALTELQGMPQRVGTAVDYGEFDPTGTFLYVPHVSSHASAVATFKIDKLSGVLTPQGDVATNGVDATFATLTRSGKFLLIAQRPTNPLLSGVQGQIAVLATDASSGIPTPVAGSPFATDFGKRTFVVAHPTRNFVYSNLFIANFGSRISVFQIDPNTGVLAHVGEESFGGLGVDGIYTSPVRIDPTGRFLYVGEDGGEIGGFTIDQATGNLTQVPGSPFQTSGNTLVTMDPSGRYLYSLSSGSGADTIASYAISRTTGTLTLVNRLPTGSHPVMVEVVGQQ